MQVTQWEAEEDKAGTLYGVGKLHPLRCIEFDTSLFAFKPLLTTLTLVSADELWIGFGSSILRIVLPSISSSSLSSSSSSLSSSSSSLSSSSSSATTKAIQSKVTLEKEVAIECTTLVHTEGQKFLWVGEESHISIWRIGERLQHVGNVLSSAQQRDEGDICYSCP